MVLSIVAILGVSAICGKVIALFYEKRESFYCELDNFCEFVKNEIGFCQTKVKTVFEKFESTFNLKNKEFFNNLKNYSENESKEELITKNLYFLKPNEKIAIMNFMKTFGEFDEKRQVSNIENFACQIKKQHEEAVLKRKQNAPLCYKLCLSVGAVVCVMIL